MTIDGIIQNAAAMLASDYHASDTAVSEKTEGSQAEISLFIF